MKKKIGPARPILKLTQTFLHVQPYVRWLKNIDF